MKIKRHLTAINRTGFSLPIRLALEHGLIHRSTTVFDYGAGKGEDLRRLRKIGVEAHGWDPVYMPDKELFKADVVNLGYVINVIEDSTERVQVIESAWALAEKALLISARTVFERASRSNRHKDGYISERGTFQKYYEQDELESLIANAINTKPVALAPGVFFAFKSKEDQYALLASKAKRIEYSSKDIALEYGSIKEELVPLLDGLRDFFSNRGRIPKPEDMPESWDEYTQHFGSIKRAFGIIRKSESTKWLEDSIQSSKNDILVLLARMLFSSRPKFSQLPERLQRDIRSHFSSYRKACEEADRLLFSAGKMDLISAASEFSDIGKKTRSAFYVHRTGLAELPPVLRVYEICAQVVAGEIPEANIVKFSLHRPRISYLVYPEFDKDPHPALRESYLIAIPDLRLGYRNYEDSENPPILHRKELFVNEGYPRRHVFARLSRIEEKHGLYDDSSQIGYKQAWEEVLEAKELTYRGHRLVKSKK